MIYICTFYTPLVLCLGEGSKHLSSHSIFSQASATSLSHSTHHLLTTLAQLPRSELGSVVTSMPVAFVGVILKFFQLLANSLFVISRFLS